MPDGEGKTLEDRVISLEKGYGELKIAIIDNTALTAKVEKNTTDIIAFFNSVRLGIGIIYTIGRFLRWLGKLAISIIAVLSVIGATAYYLRNGHLPPQLNLELDP